MLEDRIGHAAPRWLRRLLAGSAAFTLVTAGGVAYLRQDARVLSVDDAIAGYRESASTTTTSASAATADPAGAAPSPGGEPQPGSAGNPSAGPVAAASTGGTAAAATSPASPSQSQPSTGAASGGFPEGVYVYATSGYESTNALGGSRHDYPSESAMTVRSAACGWFQRWQPLAERWDESEICPEAGGMAIRRFSTYHEFFQRGQRQDFTCPPGSYVYKPDAAVGDQWRWGCSNETSAINTLTQFVGFEEVQIGGRNLKTAHMHYDSQLTGANRGVQRQDRWIDVATGQNVKIHTEVDTDADSPFGPVQYEERYTITLTSTTPRR